MNKRLLAVGSILTGALLWLLLGAAAPMPLLRNKWTTNTANSAPIIGDWQYFNTRPGNTNHVFFNDTGIIGVSDGGNSLMWQLHAWNSGNNSAISWGAGPSSVALTNGALIVSTRDATVVPFRVAGYTAQTANILETSLISGNRGFVVNSNGFGGTTNITGSFAANSYVIFRQMVDSTVTNTVAETSLMSGIASGSKTISGGILKSNAIIEIAVSGRYWSGTAGSQFKLNIGGAKIWQGVTSETPSQDGSFDISYKVYVRNTNSVTGIGKLVCVGTGTLGRTTMFWTNAAQTVNFEIDQAIDAVVTPNLTTSSYNTQGALITVTP